MAENDTCAYCPRPQDVALGFALLSRLPVRVDWDRHGARQAAASWAYPLVGLGLGALAGLLGQMALWFGLPGMAVAGLVIGALVLMTGAMHEDGLADCADGFWGGWDQDRRLEIMKDSQIGTYGVLALVLSAGLRWLSLGTLIEAGLLWPALLIVPVVSRAAMVAVMVALPHARKTGLSRHVGRPVWQSAVLAALVAGVICLSLDGTVFVLLVLGLPLVTFGFGSLARAKVGGQTGDVLGATQQVSEVAIWLVLLSMWMG